MCDGADRQSEFKEVGRDMSPLFFFLLTYIECCSHLHYTQTIQALDTRLVTFNMNLLLNMESADF